MSKHQHFGTLIGHEGMDDMSDHAYAHADELRAQAEKRAIRQMCEDVSRMVGCDGDCNRGRAPCDCRPPAPAEACTGMGEDYDDQSESAGVEPYIYITAGCLGLICAVSLVVSRFGV